MPTGAYHDIDSITRPQARTRATLLSVAQPIPDSQLVRGGTNRMAAGATWLPWPDIIVNRDNNDCETVYAKDERDLPALAVQPSFLLWDRLQCSTAGLGLDMLVDMTAQGLDEFVSAQFGLELEDAAGSGGIGLIGNATYTPAVTSGTAIPLRLALAHLEAYLALQAGAGKPGLRGVIHLTPGLLGMAVADMYVEWRDGSYQTASGHRVIGDAGHTGAPAPHGQSAAGTDEAWIYATGDIMYATMRMDGVTTVDQDDGGVVYVARNKNRPLIERVGLIVFDPNVLGAALVDIATS